MSVSIHSEEALNKKNCEKAIEDLEFLYEGMLQWKENNEITDDELSDLSDCVRIVAKHITDGNDIEGEVVGIMGGKVIELASDRIRKEVMEATKAEMDAAKAEMDAAKAKMDAAKAEVAEAKAETAEEKKRADKYLRILLENGIEVDGA